MKNLFTFIFLLFSLFESAQTTLFYTPTDAVISNPERGFYKSADLDTFSSNYTSLEEETLVNYRVNHKISLIYRGFYLESFINSPISQNYLENIQNDFDIIRNAGLKAIIRFAYYDPSFLPTGLPKDASKSVILSHILQLKPILIANSDVICVMQEGFIGTWGEWFYTDQTEFGLDGNTLTDQNFSNRKEVVEAVLNALPADRMVQIRTPSFKRAMYSTNALTSSEAYQENAMARIGHHNDCFLASDNDVGTYTDLENEYPYLEQETLYLPMGGETCLLNSPRSDCETALLEMEKFHWSFLNSDFNNTVIEEWENENCYPDIVNTLGYRFQLTAAILPETAFVGNNMPITLSLRNQGFAAPFNERKAYLVLKNQNTNQCFSLLINSNPRFWSGMTTFTISENLPIPSDLPIGNYDLYLHLPDSYPALSNRSEYAIQFANENIWDNVTGYNSLNHTVTIMPPLDNSNLEITMFPMPADSVLIVATNSINEVKFSVHNTLGQKINVGFSRVENKFILETDVMREGFYFIKFTKGSLTVTKKIIVRH